MADLFSNQEKIQQFVVQFACRIPVRKAVTSGEKKALENVLRELDPEAFQLFDEPAGQSAGALFQVLHQLPIEAAMITMPSFVLSNGSFSFIYPIKISSKYFLTSKCLDTVDLNAKMADYVVKVQDSIANLNCQRAGKIYEVVLGPYAKDDKIKLFTNIFNLNLEEIGELNLTFARYVKGTGDAVYNIQTNIRYLQPKLIDGFFVTMRIDINNRELARSMEPPQIVRVWDMADSIVKEQIDSILKLD